MGDRDRHDVHMQDRDDYLGHRDRHDVHMQDRDDHLGRRDERSDRRSRSRSNSRDRDKAMISQIIIETNKHPALSDFEMLCDDFYEKLNDEFSYDDTNDVYLDKAGRPTYWPSMKAKIEDFYLNYARENAPAIVTDYLTRFPKSNPSVLFEGKARDWVRNNFFAKIKLNEHDEKVLIKKISNIFEKEFTRQKPEDALIKLTTSVASTSVKDKAKGNKTNRRNKKMRSKTKKLQPRKKILKSLDKGHGRKSRRNKKHRRKGTRAKRRSRRH